MKPIEKRVKALEQGTVQDDGFVNPRVLFHAAVTRDDVQNNRPGHLETAIIIGAGNPQISREADETERAFLERVAAVYEPIHGPVPDGWYEDRRDAA